MKKITLIVGVVCIMSSCGLQFGNYERYKEVADNNANKDVDKWIVEVQRRSK